MDAVRKGVLLDALSSGGWMDLLRRVVGWMR